MGRSSAPSGTGTFRSSGRRPASVGYTYRMVCTNDAIFEQLMIGSDGKIDSASTSSRSSPRRSSRPSPVAPHLPDQPGSAEP